MKETIAKVNKTKSLFLENKTKLTNHQPDSLIKKGENLKSTALEMKKERLHTDYVEIQKIIKYYFMPIKWTTWKKWTNSQKSITFYSMSVCVKSLESCLTLCSCMHCRPPSSFLQGNLQARILEWIAMPSFRGSSRPRD